MKTIFTFCLSLLLSSLLNAQGDILIKHEVTNTNYISIIDHPLLNGNENATIFVTHNFESSGIIYDHPVGTWYDGANWTLFSEDIVDLVPGDVFNIYIAEDGLTISLESDGSDYTLPINNTAINNDPDANLLMAKHWNPNGVYNLQNYGFWYDDTDSRWNLYAEDINNQPTGAAYKLLIQESGDQITAIRHQATAANISLNWSTIDHPDLNGNPDAIVMAQHNWGTSGDTSNIIIDKTIGVWYTGSQWAVYIEDQTNMPEDTMFNVFIQEGTALNTTTFENKTDISMSPNPASNFTTLTANTPIKQILIYNTLGQEVRSLKGESMQQTIALEGMAPGTYLLKISGENFTEIKKLILQ